MDSEVGREASRIRIGIKVLEVGTDRWAVRSVQEIWLRRVRLIYVMSASSFAKAMVTESARLRARTAQRSVPTFSEGRLPLLSILDELYYGRSTVVTVAASTGFAQRRATRIGCGVWLMVSSSNSRSAPSMEISA